MDYRKTNAPTTTVTRDMMELCEDTGNVYESVAIIGKRANQISVEIKNDLSKKLAEFASYNDNLEEVFEISFGNKSVKVKVTMIADSTKKEDAKEMFEYL